MQCIGRKKNFKRCKNKTWFLFCHHHKFQPLILIFSISTVIGLYAGIFQDLIKPIHKYISSDKFHSQKFGSFKKSTSGFKILILPFERLQDQKDKEMYIERTIRNRLLELSEKQRLNLHVKLILNQINPITFEEGKKVGQKYNADMVIWGDLYEHYGYDSTQVCLRYVLLKEINYNLIKQGQTEIKKIGSIADIKQGFLQKDIDLVIHTIIGLEAYTKEDFKAALESFNLAYKQELLLFLEKFRMAHINKNINFLKNVYSENLTLFWDGNRESIDSGYNGLLRNSKYFDKLIEIFDNSNFRDIRFHNIDIQQHDRYKEIVGLNFQISWVTDLYNDKGFLFLMLDFKNKLNPTIHVCAWQPERFTDGRLISLFDFTIADKIE